MDHCPLQVTLCVGNDKRKSELHNLVSKSHTTSLNQAQVLHGLTYHFMVMSFIENRIFFMKIKTFIEK